MVELERHILNVMRTPKELRDEAIKKQAKELAEELFEALIKIRISKYVDSLIKEGKLKIDKSLIVLKRED